MKKTMVTSEFHSQPAPFIGRENEVAEITRRLDNDACRLLTVVGPGGIGKTCLAQKVAADLADQFRDGVHFIHLHSLDSPNQLPSAIADGLEFPLAGQAPPLVQILNLLYNKDILLVLDNFEHLLGGTEHIKDILHAAPSLKLLVTSRAILNLEEEWRYPLQGLKFPPGDDVDDPASYGAVRLFKHHAARINPDFQLDDHQQAVVEICRLVEGMPLALKLSALWIDTLPPENILAEIQKNLSFLSSQQRDLPDRHRSMEAVFDQTWKMLDQEERRVFKHLTVFQGGFDWAAAREAAGASLPTFSRLVGKSLLQRKGDHRYQIHELLRQYAAEKLSASSREELDVFKAHAKYFIAFLHNREKDLLGGRQLGALREIEADLENVRAAWRWTVAQNQVNGILSGAYPLSLALQFRSHYPEALRIVHAGLTILGSRENQNGHIHTQLQLLMDRGWLYLRLGRLEEASSTAVSCRRLYRELDRHPVPGQGTDPALLQGVIATVQGEYDPATRLGEEARLESEAVPHPLNRQFSYWLLSRATQGTGQYKRAGEYARQAYDITQETGDRWFRAYCLNEMGNVAYALKEYTASKNHYQTSYQLREAFNDPEGMAVALVHLGEVALEQRDTEIARQQFKRSLSIYRDIDDQGGLAQAQNGLGRVALVRGNFSAAHQHFHQALKVAVEIPFTPLILSLAAGIGQLYLNTGRESRGIRLTAAAAEHPASELETRTRARQTLNQAAGSPSPEGIHPAPGGVIEQDLDELSRMMLAELEQEEALTSSRFDEDRQPVADDQPLPEPLTDRELEVLGHIAQGMTNKEVADELVLSVGTVKWYTSQIYGKLQVRNRTEAVAQARELGLL